MPDPCQHRSPRPLLRKPFRYGAVALLSTVLPFIGSAPAWAEESITLDFVRHGQSTNNVPGLLNTVPPGPSLTELGQSQAQGVANVLAPENIHGIYASEFVEDQQTAAPLAAMLSLPVQILPGLNDINGGIFNGLGVNDYTAVNDVVGFLYILGPFAWTLGLLFVPEVGNPGFNGAAFEDLFGGAVQTMYNASVVNGGGNVTDVAFAAEASIAIWTLMNVNNPDFSLIFGEALGTGDFLPNAGIAVVQGEPGDWTLVSWNGQPVPPASLPTELFVDVRDLIMAPQLAAYNIFEALLTGDPTTIVNAIQAGIGEVVTATVNFPHAVITDIIDAVRGAIPFADPGTELSPDTIAVRASRPSDMASRWPAEEGPLQAPRSQQSGNGNQPNPHRHIDAAVRTGVYHQPLTAMENDRAERTTPGPMSRPAVRHVADLDVESLGAQQSGQHNRAAMTSGETNRLSNAAGVSARHLK